MRRQAELAILFVAVGAFAFMWWRHLDGDVSRFVVFGGYDGQYYYRLAVTPFSTAPRDAGVRFDYPAYRQQRIGYPLLVHLLSAGNPGAVLWLLAMVNWAAIVSIGWFGLRLAPRFGTLPAYWPGLLFSLARDLTEPLEIALLLAAIAFCASRRPYWCTIALCCAALTRETALIAAAVFLILGLVSTWRSRCWDFRLGAGLTTIGVFSIWKWTVFEMWHLPFRLGGSGVFGRPFVAIWSLFLESWKANNHFGFVGVIELFALALFTYIVLVALVQSKSDFLVKAICVAYFCFAAVLTREIWIEDWAYLRALAEFGTLGGLIIATSSKLVRRAGAALVVGGWLGIAFELLRFR